MARNISSGTTDVAMFQESHAPLCISQLASSPSPLLPSSPADLAPSSMPVERRPSNLAKHESQTLPLDLSLNGSQSDDQSSTCSDDAQNAIEKETGILRHKKHNGTTLNTTVASGYSNSLPLRPKTAEPHPRQVLYELSPVRRRTSLGPIEQSPVSPTASGFPSVVALPSKLMARLAPSVTELDEKGAIIHTGPSSSMDWPEPRRRRRRWILISMMVCLTILVILGVTLGTYFGLNYHHRT